MEYILGGIIVGLIFIGLIACVVAPLAISSMSKEERDKAGIIWKDENRQ